MFESAITTNRENMMSLERSIMAFAGFMVLFSLLLTHFIHPNFLWLTVFVGANLFQSAFTGFCPVGKLMKKFGIKSEREQVLSMNDMRSGEQATQ